MDPLSAVYGGNLVSEALRMTSEALRMSYEDAQVVYIGPDRRSKCKPIVDLIHDFSATSVKDAAKQAMLNGDQGGFITQTDVHKQAVLSWAP